MAIIVETGLALLEADAYASVVDADAYFTKRGITIWNNLTSEEKEQALTRATDYMLQEYRGKWLGHPVNAFQALDWPRTGVVTFGSNECSYGLQTYPSDSVPREVKNACIELALRASIGALNEDRSQKVIQETVGPITTKYDANSSSITSYTAVDQMLKMFMQSGGNGFKLTRC